MTIPYDDNSQNRKRLRILLAHLAEHMDCHAGEIAAQRAKLPADAPLDAALAKAGADMVQVGRSLAMALHVLEGDETGDDHPHADHGHHHHGHDGHQHHTHEGQV